MNTKEQQTLIDLRDGLISQIGLPKGLVTQAQSDAAVAEALANQEVAGPSTLVSHNDAGPVWHNARPIFYENAFGDGSGTMFTVYGPNDGAKQRPIHVTNRHVDEGFPREWLSRTYGKAYCVDADGVDLKFFTPHGIDTVRAFLAPYPPLAAFKDPSRGRPSIKIGGFPYGVRQGCIEVRTATFEATHESGRPDCPYYITYGGPLVGGMSGSPFYDEDTSLLLGAGFARGYTWDYPVLGPNHWIAAQHFYSDMPIRAM